jgi:hypothetical protein
MFGYLIPQKSELKVRELQDWQATYCGVCHAISKDCGQAPRFALQNDMASFAMLLIDLTDDTFEAHKKACIAHMIKKRPTLQKNASLTYCGDVTTLLARHKLLDMWNDEKKIYAPVANTLISSGYKKAKRRNPKLAQKLYDILNTLTEVEKDQNVSFDVPAALSGELLYEVSMHADNISDNDKKILSDMMRNLGIWIYLADAIEDKEEDIKKGCFNPLVRDGKPDSDIITHASEIMTFALSRAQLAYDLLKLDKSAPIMDNIIRYSLPTRQNMILKDKETS